MEEQIKQQGQRGQATQAPCAEGAFVSFYGYINTHQPTGNTVHTHRTSLIHLARRIHQEIASFQAFPSDVRSLIKLLTHKMNKKAQINSLRQIKKGTT